MRGLHRIGIPAEPKTGFASAQRVLRHAPDAIVLLDRGFVPIRWNEAAERMFGVSSEEGLGSQRALLCESDELYRSAREAVEAGSLRERITVDRPGADGQLRTLSVTMTILREPEGAIEGYIAVYRDATLLRRRTQQLYRLSSLVAGLASQSEDEDVVRTLLEGACELTDSDSAVFVDVGDTTCEIVAVVGAPSFVAGYRYPADVGGAAEAVRTGKAVVLDFSSSRPAADPLVRSLGFSSLLDVPLPPVPDGRRAIICVARRTPRPFATEDIAVLESLAGHAAVALHRTAALQQERRLREELEEANRLKDIFLSTVSHELRTPLTVVSGFLKLLQKPDVRLDEQTVAELIRRADAHTDRLGRLIERLLDMSKIAGGTEAKISAVDLRTAITDAVEGAPEGRVALDAVPAVTVLGNADDLQSVVRNLVDNALKYGAGTPVHVSATEEGNCIDIVVEDEGPAVPDEDVDRLFDRFYRGKSSATASGLGIGLAIVKEFTERMGGTVRYERRQPQGARFVIRLPAAFELTSAAETQELQRTAERTEG